MSSDRFSFPGKSAIKKDVELYFNSGRITQQQAMDIYKVISKELAQ